MIKRVLVNYIKKYKKLHFIVSVILIIGVIFGVICANKFEFTSINSMTDYFNNYKNNIINAEENNINELFICSFFNKIKYVFLIFIFSYAIVSFIFILIINFYKGFSLGYIISIIIKQFGLRKGILFSIINLFPQNFIYIPFFILFSVLCINFGKNLKNNHVDIKGNIIKIMLFFVLMLIICLISAWVEVEFSYKIIKKMQKFF